MKLRLKQDALVLLCFFLFARFALDTRLIYEAAEPVFYLRWDFLISSLRPPGGLTVFIGALLGQLMASRLGGALSLTVLAGILLFLSDRVFRLFAGRRIPFVRYVPLLTLTAMAGTYIFALEAVPAVLILLILAGLYLSLPKWSLPIRSGILAIITALLYLATAGVPDLFQFHPAFIFQAPFFLLGWALLCLGFELRRTLPGARKKACFLLMPAVVIGPLAGELYFRAALLWKWHALFSGAKSGLKSLLLLLAPGLTFWSTILTLAMYASVTAMVVLSFIIQRAQLRSPKFVDALTADGSPPLPGAQKNKGAFRLLGTMATLGLLAGAMLLPNWAPHNAITTSSAFKRWLNIEYCVRKGQYGKALNEASKLEPWQFDSGVLYDINLALSQSGWFLDDLFIWINRTPPTQPWQILEFNQGNSTEITTYIFLGRINDAERLAYELRSSTQKPGLIWQLALIHLVKDDYETARIYLNMLADNPLYRRRATRYLDLLNRDPHLSDVPEIKELKTRMLTEDDIEQTITYQDETDNVIIKDLFLKPLEKDPSNRLALDYLLGGFLLQGNSSAIANNIYRLPPAGYQKLPLLVQEALLVYQYQGGRDVNMAGLKLDPRVATSFQEFLNLDIVKNIKQLESADDLDWQALEKFFNTYWFHVWFRLKEGGRL
ncbi:MAG: DUF6057 family protein [Candidatus Omnitrophica bacterium]|nr:DUF6057 family protein [Candidatus Omnitrophota bacterium]